jgi:hypothetical protein
MSQVTFPELSFCTLDRYKLNNSNGYAHSYRWIPSENVSASEYYSNITYSKSELLDKIQVATRNYVNNKTKLTFKGMNMTMYEKCGNNEDTAITTKPYYWYGECTILTLPKCILEASPIQIELFFKRDVVISLTYPGQFTGATSLV